MGKPVPEFTTGDECLFCHRNDVGPSWKVNRHNRTIRRADAQAPALAALMKPAGLKPQADEAQFLLGGGNRQRFLKRAEEYGKLELLSVAWQPPRDGKEGRLLDPDRPHWDAKRFGDACAGCHATGVDSKQRTFAAVSLDCFVCHGEVPENHGKEPGLALLSRKSKTPARVAMSICAQCHVRTGKSRSTGLPYPNNFVAGDNLFRDFQVDWSDEAVKRLNPGDAHVLENVRDVVIRGKEDVTCLTCHEVHKQATKKHHRLDEAVSCLYCHSATGSKKAFKVYEVHSATCGY